MGETWQALERLAAQAFGGQRHFRWGRRESTPDVDLPAASRFSVEAKYRRRLPKRLLAGLLQAARYAPGKIPALVVKERNQPGALVVLRLDDFRRLMETPKEARP